MTMLSTVASVLGVSGAICVALGLAFEANLMWLVGNAMFIIYLGGQDESSMQLMFGLYFLIAAYGVANLSGMI